MIMHHCYCCNGVRCITQRVGLLGRDEEDDGLDIRDDIQAKSDESLTVGIFCDVQDSTKEGFGDGCCEYGPGDC